MRISEYWRLMDDEFGAGYSRVLSSTLVLAGVGGRTADHTGVLNGAATFPQMISIAGVNLFGTGQTTRPLAIGDSNTPLASVLPLNNAVNTADTSNYTTAENNARRASFARLRAADSTASPAGTCTPSTIRRRSSSGGSTRPSRTTSTRRSAPVRCRWTPRSGRNPT